jgi:site-specific DNA recombinase
VSDAYIYRESGVSAYRSKHRPEMERLLADLESGAINGVICWMFRRMFRDRRYRARMLDLADELPCRIISVSEGLDSRDKSSGFVFDLLGAMARQESWNTSVDSRRGKLARIMDGWPPGGPRCYGFTVDGLGHVEHEATLLREAAQRVRAGQGLSTICKDWNRRGERLPGGEFWSPTPLRNKLLAPRVGGVASHHGELLEEVTVRWQPIIPTDEWREVRRIFLDPARRAGGRPARFLLSSFAYCGECAHRPRLAGRSFSDKNHGDRYICNPSAGGCYLSVSAPELESYVSGVVIGLLDDDAVVRALLKAGADPARVKQLHDQQADLYRRQQTELPTMLGKPGIPPSVIEQAAADIAKQLADIDSELRRLQPKRPFIRLGDTAVGTWLAANPAQAADDDEKAERLKTRRALLGSVIARVVVHGAKPSAGKFNADRIEVIPQPELTSDRHIARIVNAVLRAR